ncbi:polysaccharide pyruvyl transferase CsaB [Petroclostridium sp. X23]|uniref:polysaccharide pyruvyl transferase CsaB n=1 Tax=Petroclostridium sp. X23 TaxID=3045146 RepID=UPI0024ADEF05|nr:polysaccharide pyruvyl transferase CsaB [Petroclostridium sp. X23]WHH58383.1 polysaccharide pyruvyl transferase CsaB [Petroclostridium sp. X23]
MMYDVVISGYYGFKNSGDDAILLAIIQSLKVYKPDIKINVLSMNPRETRRLYGVDSVNRFNLLDLYRVIKNCKLFINGGGSLLQDITSTRSLLYYLETIKLALKMNKKVMLYANGIGPIRMKSNEKMVRDVANRVDLITLREEASLKEIQRLGIDKPPVWVTADPALTLKPVDDEKVDKMLMDEGIQFKNPVVCISIRGWQQQENKYSDIIAKAADYMKDTYNTDILLMPMHFPQDLHVMQEIAQKMKHTPFILKKRYQVPELLGIIKRTDLLIGMRLHALIYAATLAVPMIGLAYEAKVEGFLNYLGQACAGDISTIQYDQLCEIIDDIWPNRHNVCTQMQDVVSKLKEKAMENARMAVELIEKQ